MHTNKKKCKITHNYVKQPNRHKKWPKMTRKTCKLSKRDKKQTIRDEKQPKQMLNDQIETWKNWKETQCEHCFGSQRSVWPSYTMDIKYLVIYVQIPISSSSSSTSSPNICIFILYETMNKWFSSQSINILVCKNSENDVTSSNCLVLFTNKSPNLKVIINN